MTPIGTTAPLRGPTGLSILPTTLALALAGCGVGMSDDVDTTTQPGATAVAAAAPALGGIRPGAVLPPPTGTPVGTVSQACPGDRWIGVLDRGDCRQLEAKPGAGAAGTWRVTRLFDDELDGKARNNPAAAMAQYCAIEWVPAPGALVGTPPTEAPAISQPLRSLSPDCHVVAPMADSLNEVKEVPVQMFNSFLAHVGALAGPPKGASPVRVAVIDSSPENLDDHGRAGKGRYLHGRAVARISRTLTCPSNGREPEQCIAHISPHLAFPRIKPQLSDHKEGGYFGSQGDLARALFRADEVYQTTPVAGAKKKTPLVVVMSLGWDTGRGYDGDYRSSPTELRGPARAVHDAITRLVCHGALVIAAAGNRSGGSPETTGAMFPAAWESKPAPTAEDCRRVGAPPANVLGTAAPDISIDTPADATAGLVAPVRYRPLLYAAGAVDGTDQPIQATRILGKPRLAAMGFHVAALDDDAGGFTEVFTGTSMSAAVVAATAAAVWGYAPRLQNWQVMQIVHRSAYALTMPADYCLGGGAGCGPVKRVSLCRAVHDICSIAALCPTAPPPCHANVPPYTGQNASWDPAVWHAAVASVNRVEGTLPGGPICPGTSCSPSDTYPTNAATPWVNPQPGWPGCPTGCIVEETEIMPLADDAGGSARPIAAPIVNGALHFSTYKDFSWSSVVITISDTAGTRSYDLSSLVNTTAGKRTFVIDGIPLHHPISSATISFGHAGGSTSDQLLFWRK